VQGVVWKREDIEPILRRRYLSTTRKIALSEGSSVSQIRSRGKAYRSGNAKRRAFALGLLAEHAIVPGEGVSGFPGGEPAVALRTPISLILQTSRVSIDIGGQTSLCECEMQQSATSVSRVEKR
jgi:hypothetical protein